MKHSRHTPMILIVDDDTTTNIVFQEILARSGYHTTSAYSVAEALIKIGETLPDLVLLDVNLPDGSGFEVCRNLQTRPGAIPTPVLFISSNNDVSTKVLGFEAGGVDFVSKPLAGAEILARVSTHIRLKQAFERLAELQADQIQRLAGLQEALMPVPEDVPDACFQIFLHQIHKIGGDFYDVIPVGNRVIDYIVADASGHDLAASFWTSALKTLLNEYATAASRPSDILRSINSALRKILPSGAFFTLIYARLNRQIGLLTLANAGHPPAIVLNQRKKELTVAHQNGDVVGVFDDVIFEVSEFKVKDGDRFFLFSDGLIELHGSRQSGLDALVEACNTYRNESIDKAVNMIHQKQLTGLEPQDDVILMGVTV